MSERWSEMDDMELVQMEAELRGELSDLREAATVYAARAWERNTPVEFRRPAARRRWTVWSAAGATAAVLIAGGAHLVRHQVSPVTPDSVAVGGPAVQVHPAPSVSDEALLDQIQSDLSTGVPAAMEPLQASDVRAAQDRVQR